MKNFKRVLAIIMTILLITLAAGCSKTSNSASNTSETSSNSNTATKEVVTIKYANWNLGTEEENNLERQMIQAFMETHPNIKVEIDESISTQDWNGSLATAAASGEMPDVFMLINVPTGIANGWLYDLSSLAQNDNEWNQIPKNITDTINYNGKIYAVPFAEHFMGYYINKDIFDKENITPLKFGFTVDEFKKAVLDLTKPSKGIIGLDNESEIIDWYPGAVSNKYGWYTWDGKGFNLTSQEFIDGVNLAKTFDKAGAVFNALSDEQKAKIAGSKDANAWQTGHVAIHWDGTWMIPDFKKNLNFNWAFVGIPNGRTPVTLDYLGISKSTKHPQEAYEFAKWMSFSKEGYLKRLELAQKSGTYVNSLPIMNDKELIDKFISLANVEGLKEAYDNINNSFVEGFKFIPGYVDARWNAPTGIKIGDKDNATIGDVLWNAPKLGLKIEDYVNQLNKLANEKYQEAEKAIK